MMRLRAGSSTDVGNVREMNQDNLLEAGTLYAVADGMGGHVAGELASEEAVNALGVAYEGESSADALLQAFRWANRAVWRRGQEEPQYAGMGTTLTAVALVDGLPALEDGDAVVKSLAVANVGDSRTYLLRDGQLTLLTSDHSFVQEMVRSGQLSPGDAQSHPRRSQLTRALGIAGDVDVDIATVDPLAGDRLLLCSDGLWDEVADRQIAVILREQADPTGAADELVRVAKEHGGRDNITAIVVDVVDDGETAAAASAASAALADEPTTVVSRADIDRALAADAPPAPSRPPAPAASADEPPGRAAAPKTRLVTGRVVAFLVALVLLLGAAAFGVTYVGGRNYFVGVDADHVAIWKGPPGGFLWVSSKKVETSELPRAAVVPDQLATLQRGKSFATLAEARHYIDGLSLQAAQAGRLVPDGATVIGGATTSSTAGVTTTSAVTSVAPGDPTTTVAPTPTSVLGG